MMTTIKGTDMVMEIGGNDIDDIAPPTSSFSITGKRITLQSDVSPLRLHIPQTMYMRPGKTPISLTARIAWKLSWWLRNVTEYPAFKWGQYSSKEYALTGAEVDEMNEEKVNDMTLVDVSWTADKVCLYNETYGNWQWVDDCEKGWMGNRRVS